MGRARTRRLTPPPPLSIVLDAGALIALEKRDPRLEALLRRTLVQQTSILIPAGVLAQVWTGDARQAPIHALLKRATTQVVAMDRVLAEAIGRLCVRAGSSDVVDASVVLVARQVARAIVLTSDPEDLRRLDPDLPIEVV